jgi:hypothetical protein
LRRLLNEHDVTEAFDLGWDRLVNGDLLAAAEQAGFALMITADKNIRYQQNLGGRKIALLVLGNAQWPVLRLLVDLVIAAVNESSPRSYREIEIPGHRA